MRALEVAVAMAGVGLALGGAGVASTEPCTDLSRACVIEVARTYVDAQAGGEGRAEDMRLSPHAVRWENGVVTGTSGEDIRSRSGGGPSPVFSQRDKERVWVDGNDAFFFWIVDVRLPGSQSYVATAHIAERVRVEDGDCGDGPSPCVTEVEAVLCIAQRGREEATPPPEQGPVPQLPTQFLCHRSG